MWQALFYVFVFDKLFVLQNKLPPPFHSLLSSFIGFLHRSWTNWEHSWFRAFILAFPQLFPILSCTHIGMAYSLTYSEELCSNSLFSILPILQSTSFIASIYHILLVFFVLALILNLKYNTMYLNITLFIIHNTLLEVKIYENKKLFVFITSVSKCLKYGLIHI